MITFWFVVVLAIETPSAIGELKDDSRTNTFQKDGFDVVVMNMGIMDVHDLEPLAASLTSLLKQDGWLALLLFELSK